jgi:hypothetical protein
MKDFRDRFIRASNPDEQPSPHQPAQPRSSIGPVHPAPVEAATRPEPPIARGTAPEKPRSSLLPIPSGKAKRTSTQTAVVQRSLVSVWSERSYLSNRVGTVQNGELLTIVDEEDDWLQIRCGTRVSGWVRAAELVAFHDPYTGLGERDDIL